MQLSTTDNIHAHTIHIHHTTNSITANTTDNFTITTNDHDSTSNFTTNASSTNDFNNCPRTNSPHFTHDAHVS